MTDRLVTPAIRETDIVAVESASPPVRYQRRALAVVALVVLLGPPIGSLLISVPVAPFLFAANVSDFSLSGLFSGLASAVMLAAFAAMFSYIYGGLAALISALWLGTRTYHCGTFGYEEAVLVAVVASCLGGLAMAMLVFEQPSAYLTFLVMLIPASIVSALMCRWLLGRLGILPSSPPRLVSHD